MEEQKTWKWFIVFLVLFVLFLFAFMYVRNVYLKYIRTDSNYITTDSSYDNVDFDSDVIDIDSDASDIDSDVVDIDWDKFTWHDITICNDIDSCITLMDRNLWATTNDITKAGSYWYYFQWWNNYWFKSNALNGKSWQVDASGYWPNNPYNSGVFLYWKTNRTSVWNDNLRWWSWDSEYNHRWWDNIYLTAEDRQWPCPQWYHVPSIWERNELFYYWYNSLDTKYWDLSKNYSLYGLSDQEWKIWKMITEYFYIPTAGNIITNRRGQIGTDEMIPYLVWLVSTWMIAQVWSSTPFWQYDRWWSHDFIRTFYVGFYWNSDSISVGISGIGGSEWLPIRCFKNPNRNN